eukprot:4104376-Alexandrium_andersonii.AAC.1
MFTAHAGTRPGDPFGDMLWCLLADRVASEIHFALETESLVPSIPFDSAVSCLSPPSDGASGVAVREVAYVDDVAYPVAAGTARGACLLYTSDAADDM